jgi:hypothetical protein
LQVTYCWNLLPTKLVFYFYNGKERREGERKAGREREGGKE